MLAALFLTLLVVVGCRNATKTVEETDAAAELGRDGKCWHLVRLHGAEKSLEWLNEEDANGYELVAIASR